MNQQSVVFCVIGSLLLLAAGCGEEEAPPDPRQRCADEQLKAHALGSIDADEGRSSIDITTGGDTPGRITSPQIRIRLGEASIPGSDSTRPLILRLHDPNAPDEFGRALADLTRYEALNLDVIDASEVGPGSEDLTSMADFACAIEYDTADEDCEDDADCAGGYLCRDDESVCAPDPDDTQGTICAQIGFDENENNNLHSDHEEYVYNAVGGEVTIEGFDSPSQTFAADWSLDLGQNVLQHGDESSGEIEGCIRPSYSTQIDHWPLE